MRRTIALGALLAWATLGQTRLAPRRGEICFLCNQPIEATDIVYQIDGQRMPVHTAACDDKYRAQPQRWLARLKARGAFLGAVPDRRSLSPGWFLAGLYVLTGLVFAGVSAHRALHSGYRPARWFFTALALNAPAYFYLLTRPKQPSQAPSGLRKVALTSAPQACPQCGDPNHPTADVCLGCGARLNPGFRSEVTRC
jgi:hypothetical protein